MVLASEEGSLYGIHYDSLTARLNYFARELSIEELALNYMDNLIQGTASVGFLPAPPLSMQVSLLTAWI